MTRSAVGLRTLVAALILVFAATSAAAQDLIAITPVTVVDVTDGSLQPGQTVLVEGHRVVTVGPADDVAVPQHAEVVDATGGYLIPGLWDMHVHTVNSAEWVERFFPLFLANGVTGVRDMWHYREVAEAAEAAVAAGELPGPARIAVAGNLDRHVAELGLEHDPSREEQLFGGPVVEQRALAVQANPITYVDAEDPPFLLIHGDSDPVVPYRQSELLRDALDRAGVPVELYRVRGGAHGGFGDPGAWERTRVFLRRHPEPERR